MNAPGRTSNGDDYIVLFSANEKLNHKICRVYKEAFNRLPDFVDTQIPANAGNGNPTREEASKRRILRTCPLFKIVTFDGRETAMGPERRFYATLYVYAQEA
ncbi:MAG: hypothetical protein MUO62_03475 [Anaerolineales bacterium]|nr:hypothetical protein [Anaerolineales bacterium]